MKGLNTLSLVALVGLMATAPANAQYQQYQHRWGGGGGPASININATQANLQARINAGIASRRLSRSEANSLQNKLSQISQLEANMRMSGNRLSFRERADLTKKLSRLNNDVTRQLNDFEHRRVGYFGNRSWR